MRTFVISCLQCCSERKCTSIATSTHKIVHKHTFLRGMQNTTSTVQLHTCLLFYDTSSLEISAFTTHKLINKSSTHNVFILPIMPTAKPVSFTSRVEKRCHRIGKSLKRAVPRKKLNIEFPTDFSLHNKTIQHNHFNAFTNKQQKNFKFSSITICVPDFSIFGTLNQKTQGFSSEATIFTPFLIDGW